MCSRSLTPGLSVKVVRTVSSRHRKLSLWTSIFFSPTPTRGARRGGLVHDDPEESEVVTEVDDVDTVVVDVQDPL